MRPFLTALCLLSFGCIKESRSLVLGPINAELRTRHLVCNDGSLSSCSPYSRPQEPAYYQTTLEPMCCEGHGGPKYLYGDWVYQ